MQRLAFLIIVMSVFVGVAMPSHAPSATEVNQSVLIDDFAQPAAESNAAMSVGPSYGSETRLDRAANGHFYTSASVNGRSLDFVVDTGASSVALTLDAARSAGLVVDPSAFSVVGEGASGPTRGMRVTLDRVEVAGRTIEHVDAVVLEGLPVNLLGQSVLTRFNAVEMAGDRMVLR